MAPMAEPAVEVAKAEAQEESKVKIEDASDSDSDDDIPALEDQPQPGESAEAHEARKKQSRSEKKARKSLLKLGLKPIPEVVRVTIKQPKGLLFVFSKPDVFKSPTSETYVVFGEPKVEDLGSQAVAKAAEQFKANPELAAVAKGGDDDELPDLVEDTTSKAEGKEEAGAEEDLDGVDPADVNLVIAQTQASRAKAIKALKNHKGDLLAAILEVTESK
jgi:nascent polypeptide-associated complex subunit alpha